MAARYTEALSGIVETPIGKTDAFHPYYMYVIRTPKREQLMAALREKHIECGIHYPVPLHLQPAYGYLGMKRGDLPITERVAGEILSIPLYPEMSERDQNRVISAVLEMF